MTLPEAFSQIKDHRRGPAVRHDLTEMIVMSICAVLCGCDDWVDVADWCEEEGDWLKTFLVLAKGTSSHDTFGEVFRVQPPRRRYCLDQHPRCFRWLRMDSSFMTRDRLRP